jgi:Phosphorylase superfamily
MARAAAARQPSHPQRREIARYLLGRGLDDQTLVPSAAVLDAAAAAPKIAFPDGLAPQPVPAPANWDPDSPLPAADVVVITWTVDELAGLARVFTPGHSAAKWARYTHNYASKFAPLIRAHAPAATSKRLGSFQMVTVAGLRVLCMKSELHLNQDGIKTGTGTATLPVKDLFLQIIGEAAPQYVFTVGTSGSVFDDFQLGDVVVTRAAKFRLNQEFRNEPFNGVSYRSDWQIPTGRLDTAQQLMAGFADDVIEPPFAPPTTAFPFPGPPIVSSPANTPDIKLEQGARDMPEFHPILTTDYFEYGTTVNRLDTEGAAVEMGDAALGLAASELANPPKWAVVRNMSDPVINGALPAKQYKLNEQTTWAVGYYTAYGEWTSTIGALATWGIIAAIAEANGQP